MPKGIMKERKLPKVGTIFIRTVVEDDEKIKYMSGGEIFNSPTAAAKSLLGTNYAVNGWVFLGMKNY